MPAGLSFTPDTIARTAIWPRRTLRVPRTDLVQVRAPQSALAPEVIELTSQHDKRSPATSCGKNVAPSVRTAADPQTSVRQFSNPATSEAPEPSGKVVILQHIDRRPARLGAAEARAQSTAATSRCSLISRAYPG